MISHLAIKNMQIKSCDWHIMSKCRTIFLKKNAFLNLSNLTHFCLILKKRNANNHLKNVPRKKIFVLKISIFDKIISFLQNEHNWQNFENKK